MKNQLEKNLRDACKNLDNAVAEVRDHYGDFLHYQSYISINWDSLLRTFDNKIRQSQRKKEAQKNKLSVASLEADGVIQVTSFYKEVAIRLRDETEERLNNLKLSGELLIEHGFELCWDGDYFKRREGDEKGYQTLRLSKRDDYFVSHLPTIELYTLNDLKMLWFLRTREELMEV
ncbi:hypothetical protein ACE193_21360 [Bernardetia sp. OM2101]|uniref:hypothetical protein n=1 Tax=Bernardetia sp. OM2101 TaxID=3344876 RepID=UPI0035CF2493